MIPVRIKHRNEEREDPDVDIFNINQNVQDTVIHLEVDELSGHAIAYRWRSLPRVRRHRASKPQGNSEGAALLISRSPWIN